MTSASCRHLPRAAGACLLLVLSACSAVNRLPPGERSTAQLEAKAVLQQLALTNASLSSFKRLGRIKLWDADRPPLSERVAWIVSAPEKLGLVVLAAGRPVVPVSPLSEEGKADIRWRRRKTMRDCLTMNRASRRRSTISCRP